MLRFSLTLLLSLISIYLVNGQSISMEYNLVREGESYDRMGDFEEFILSVNLKESPDSLIDKINTYYGEPSENTDKQTKWTDVVYTDLIDTKFNFEVEKSEVKIPNLDNWFVLGFRAFDANGKDLLKKNTASQQAFWEFLQKIIDDISN